MKRKPVNVEFTGFFYLPPNQNSWGAYFFDRGCDMAVNIDGGIKNVNLKGYKSIRDSSASLNNLNVLVGANGCGKSNFLSFFRMLQFYLNDPNGLSEFVGRNGSSEMLFYYGAKATNSISADLTFHTASGPTLILSSLAAAKGGASILRRKR